MAEKFRLTHKHITGFIFFGIVIIFFALTKFYHVTIDDITRYVHIHPIIGQLVFVLFYAMTVLCMFLPETAFTISAGIIFHPWEGFLLAMLGGLIGATVAFLMARYLFHDYFHKKIASTGLLKWTKIRNQPALRWLVFIARVNPLIPYNLANYAFGLTKITVKNYVFATLTGIAIPTFFFVFMGNIVSKLMKFNVIFTISMIIMLIAIAYFIADRKKK